MHVDTDVQIRPARLPYRGDLLDSIPNRPTGFEIDLLTC
tara:strand:+ start:2165 stop:2281 length:117 start_codon:yes stop_codon:yes gene_type:complete